MSYVGKCREKKKKQEKEGIKFWDWGGQKVTFFFFIVWPAKISSRS